MAGGPAPDLPAMLGGDLSSVSYTLSEMAADTIGLVDTLGLQEVHVVGASMGGAIAQTLAIEYPERVLSLTSMMSTTGDPAAGQPDPEILGPLFSGGRAVTREAYIARALRASALVGSPGYPSDEHTVAVAAGRAFDRGQDEVAAARQAVASLASGDRTQSLRELALPARVIHGLDDRMCDPSGGRATAAAIPDAELVLIDGMGTTCPRLCGRRSPMRPPRSWHAPPRGAPNERPLPVTSASGAPERSRTRRGSLCVRCATTSRSVC
ncbi:MAG: alpha/beta fold hydrolase [Solirubrobacteraceae bacterium]